MLGIGIGEMIIIAGLALIIMGPEKFPEFAKIVLRTVRDLRTYVDDAKNEITKELRPIEKEMHALTRYDTDQYMKSLGATPPKKKPAPYQGADKPRNENADAEPEGPGAEYNSYGGDFEQAERQRADEAEAAAEPPRDPDADWPGPGEDQDADLHPPERMD